MDFSSRTFSLDQMSMQKPFLFLEQDSSDSYQGEISLTGEDSTPSSNILSKNLPVIILKTEKKFPQICPLPSTCQKQRGEIKMNNEMSDIVKDKSTKERIVKTFWNEIECEKKKNSHVEKQPPSLSSANNKLKSEAKSTDRSDSSLPDQVAQQVVVQCAGFKDIAGLEAVKQTLREAIIYPTKYPQLFKDGRSAWSRALLYGPPGVGKTALIHAAAAEAQLPLYQVSSADLMNAWVGNTEKLIRRLFSTLGDCRCILLLDEVDSLCRKRGAGDSDHGRRASTEMLIQMSRYEGSAMFLLCATNCPWEIDPAFLRRLQQRIYVPMPDVEARESIILSCIGALGELSAGPEWGRYLHATAGLSGSDLKGLVRSALMVPLREMQTATHWIETCGKMVPTSKANIMAMRCTLDQIPNWLVWCRQINIGDLWLALEQADRTVSQESLASFQDFLKGRKVVKTE